VTTLLTHVLQEAALHVLEIGLCRSDIVLASTCSDINVTAILCKFCDFGILWSLGGSVF
jgi:hypothetical protein